MLITIITFVIILGILILVHELGHFVTARFFGVKAEEFGFGYPPRIFGFVKDDNGKWKRVGGREDAGDYQKTVWSLNWLPLGGFVTIKGQDGDKKEEENSFGAKPIWQRFVMLFAGVFMNFVLCAVLLSFGFMTGVPTMVDDSPDKGADIKNEQVLIMSVSENSPAEKAGIEIGDVILEINNKKINKITQVQESSQMAGEAREMIILREESQVQIEIIPESQGYGVGLVKTATVSYPWYKAIYKGAENTVGLTIAILKAFGGMFADLFKTGKVTADVAGPVGIAVLTGQVVQLGWIYVLQFAALLSINLAIINILPIPALDGGRILFLIIEKFKGRPVKQELEGKIHQFGFILLMLLMALVIFKDFRTYGAGMWNAVRSWF